MVEIVAEISGNHGGDILKAQELIYEAAEAGCDYAKFQYYWPPDMPDFEENKEMYEKLYVSDEWLPALFEMAKECSIGLFASVFSIRAAKDILKYDVPYIKLASPGSTRLPFETYQQIAKVIPPEVTLIISTGREDLREMKTLEYRAYSTRVMLCPPHGSSVSENDLQDMGEGYFWGLSDHTPGIRAPMAFIRSGARMVEKHLKLEGDDECVDAAFSADPKTMQLLCKLAHNNR